MKILVILAVRNESLYIQRCLDHLLNDKLDVFIFDNESTDDTLDICRLRKYTNIVGIESIPYAGYFDLTKQLEYKEKLRSKIDYDWVIHLDADEFLFSDIKGESIYDSIKRVDALGYNCINFNEIVFIPESDGVHFEATPYDQKMSHYYYFHPHDAHRVIAFKNALDVSNVSSGGHNIDLQNVQLYPTRMHMCHYIALSRSHIVDKYQKREYNPEELEKGWFCNRLVDWKSIQWPNKDRLKVFDFSKGDFDLSEPKSNHFWEWPQNENVIA